QGIYVTDAEVDAKLQDDLKQFGNNITLAEFETNILRRFNKTMFEWREDVIRPKLLMSKLVRPTIVVTEEDMRNAFETRYGEKVECRIIVLEENDRHRDDKWQRASKSDAEFKEIAKTQFLPDLAARGGQVPPIHKHFGSPKLEQIAFSLKDGDVSCLEQMPDKTWIILKRDKLIPADNSVRLDTIRMQLHNEVFEFKLAQEIPKVFKRLR